MTDLKSHQDYADWELTGRRFYITNPDWDWDKEEFEEAISVNGRLTTCDMECRHKTRPVLKMTCDTPNMHQSAEGGCLECMLKLYANLPNETKLMAIVDEDGMEAKI